MATKLKNLRLTSVDLVPRGANQEADICLYKSADEAESPTEREKNIFKRFLGWLRENPAEAEYEADSTTETEVEVPETPEDPADLYKSAIFESLQSILTDETLTDEDRGEMITKSIEEYHEAMVELAKFNPNHDASGRFASGGGGGSASSGSSSASRADMTRTEYVKDLIRSGEIDQDTAGFIIAGGSKAIKEAVKRGYISQDVAGQIAQRPEKTEKADRYDDIEEIEEIEVEKFNPNHDASGRFASGGGGGAKLQTFQQATSSVNAKREASRNKEQEEARAGLKRVQAELKSGVKDPKRRSFLEAAQRRYEKVLSNPGKYDDSDFDYYE